MSVDSISSAYGLSFWQLKQNSNEASGGSAQASTTSYQSSANANAAYSSTNDMVSTLSAAIKQAMTTLGLGKNDRVTFATLNEARAKMEQDFTSTVKADLKKLGVDEAIEFRLVTNSQGGVEVISDHADKAKVEKYFKDNPTMVEKFQEIQAMSNVEAARKASGYDIKAMRERIQVESMVDWFAGTGQGVQQLMQYSDTQSVFASAGLNKVA